MTDASHDRYPTIQDLAVSVAAIHATDIPDRQLARLCHEATSNTTHSCHLFAGNLGRQPEREALLEAQWSMTTAYARYWTTSQV